MDSSVVCACSSLKGYRWTVERYVTSASALSTAHYRFHLCQGAQGTLPGSLAPVSPFSNSLPSFHMIPHPLQMKTLSSKKQGLLEP